MLTDYCWQIHLLAELVPTTACALIFLLSTITVLMYSEKAANGHLHTPTTLSTDTKRSMSIQRKVDGSQSEVQECPCEE
jgi:hypothetical protein